jgi:hypothetical protein
VVDSQFTEDSGVGTFNKQVWGELRERRQRLYETTWQRVKEAVNASNPEGLLALGAPDDEYEDAVGDLTRRLLKGELTNEAWLSSWFQDRYGLVASVRVLVNRLVSIATDLQRERDS